MMTENPKGASLNKSLCHRKLKRTNNKEMKSKIGRTSKTRSRSMNQTI